MTKESNCKLFCVLRPIVVVAYSFIVAISLYAFRYFLFVGEEYAFSTIIFFNIGCGIVYFIGWYACMALVTKSLRLEQTFMGRTQYILTNLLGIIPIKLDTDLFVQWQVKPFELEGLEILCHFVVSYFVNILILSVVCLFIVKCKFPTKIALVPFENNIKTIFPYVLVYVFCGILFFASIQNIYAGVYYHASIYWMFVYTILSVVNARAERRRQ